MHALSCPSEQAVEDFLSRRLPSDVAVAFEAHLDACGECRALVSALAAERVDDLTLPAGTDVWQLAPGARLGRLVVGERLGAGGMGVVHAAEDPELERLVAVKLLHDPDDGQHLLREGKALARLAHPNIVTVHDVGEQNGRVFIAMELVDGATLGAWLRATPRSRGEILDVLDQAGRGLAAAHAAGIVHRDFKPDNVLVGRDGRARVGDFGLVHVAATALAGTPAYMAPEQIDGGAVDARADQFAFAVVLAEALAGERPFRGASLGELRRAIARGPELAGVPRHLRAVVRRGLAEVAADRFSSMDALLDAIIRARRRPRRIAAAIGAGVVVLGLVGWATLRGERAEPCPDATPRLAGVWDAPTQSAIERAFLATGAPYAADAWRGTQPVLDRYAQAWVAMHRESCLATAVRHEQSADLLDRRTACLARRANELRALTALFGHADATAVEHAVSAANMLTPIDDCSGRDVTASRSDPVALAVERALADVKARWTAGSVASADAELEQLVRDARALRDPTLLARTLLQRGLWQRDLAPTAGQPVLREAARVAEAAGLDAVKADALIGIVGALGVTFEGATLAEALAVADDARATLQRIGGDPAREAHLEEAVCDVYEAAGKVADAQACATHALTIVAPDRRAAVEVTLGTILHDLGRLADSRAHYARALALVEERSGPHHPDIAVVLHDRALDFQEEGKLDEARADFERSLAILEAAYGRDAAPVAQSLAGLGNTLEYQGDHATALRHLTRARAIYVRIRGTEDVGILDGIGRVERALGHFAAAQALHEQALALRRAELGPEDADVAISHENLGQLFEVQKRYQLALAHYREALRIHEKALGSDSPLVALDKKLIRDVEGR